jgi:threonine dehydrogenase-like Zn-dependent dehydrogenase
VTSTARALWTVAPGRADIREEPLQSPGEDEVLVRARYSGISRGTEALVYAGSVPRREYQRMRAPFQAGDFPFPVKYGYASVGEIEEGPSALRSRAVFVLHPHQDRYIVPAAAARVLPADVPIARAVLGANMETAVNAVWDAELTPGQRVTVVGAGVVGCLTAWAAQTIADCEVTLADVRASREPVARALGVRFAAPPALTDDADVVVHASATPDGLTTALRAAKFEGTVIELSWYGDRLVPVPLGEDFHARRLTIKSSQVGHVAASRRREMTYAQRLDYALSLLIDAALDLLVSGEMAFEDLPSALPALFEPGADVLCQRVRY